MAQIKYNNQILNQKGNPAWYEDTLANRPAFGFTGRMFIAVDTFAFYRDNGSGWDLVGGTGGGAVTGTGVSGQLALWNGTTVLNGDTGITFNSGSKKITTGGYVITGGLSTQFLKGDGTVDTNTYLTATSALTNFVDFATAQTITAVKTLAVSNSSTQLILQRTTTSTGISGIGADNLSSFSISTTPYTTKLWTLDYSGGSVQLSSATATAFIVSGGLSTQFLKANGTLDGSTYQPTISITTAGTSGASTFISNVINIPNYTLAGLGGLSTATAASTYVPYTGATGPVSLNTQTLASGQITSSAGFTSTLVTGVFLNAQSGTTSALYGYIQNTSGRFYWGVESSTGSNITTGSTAYYSQISCQGLQFSGNNGTSVHMTLPPSGNFLIGSTTDSGQAILQVNGGVTMSALSASGQVYASTATLSKLYYHVFTGAAAQTLTMLSPLSNNYQYVIINNTAVTVTIAAAASTNIITLLNTSVASIVLAANARAIFIADGNNKYYQIL